MMYLQVHDLPAWHDNDYAIIKRTYAYTYTQLLLQLLSNWRKYSELRTELNGTLRTY